MDHVIASADEDAATAERLVELLLESGLPGAVRRVAVDDETSLEAALQEDPDGTATHVLLLSRTFASRIRSLGALDELLGALLLGRRRVLAACLAGPDAPPPDVMRVVRRHDGIADEATIEEAARRIVGRLALVEINAPSTPKGRRAGADVPRLRYWLVGAIVVLIAVLVVMSVRSLLRS